jgi:hypothetical protein
MGRGGKYFLPFFLLSVNLLVNMVPKNSIVCKVLNGLRGFFMLTIFVLMQCRSFGFRSMKC